MPERRHQKRYNIQTTIQVSYQDQKFQTINESFEANINNEGAFLPLTESLPLNSRVNVKFLLTLNELKKLRFILSMAILKELSCNQQVWITTSAIVIRQQKNGVAVIFEENYQLTPLAKTTLL